MQVTIEIEPHTFSLIKKAKAKGLSLDGILTEALDKYDEKKKEVKELSVEERIERFNKWAKTPRNLPPLSDEMLRRENIYEDRA
ncbi:hypothetical protein BH20ACI2_BH20ACI2_23230 [soil metagenome]